MLQLFQRISLPRSSQIPNSAPFFGEIPDPKNTLPDPGNRSFGLCIHVKSVFVVYMLLLMMDTLKSLKTMF